MNTKAGPVRTLLCSLFKRTIGRLEAVHEFAPSYCVAALCLILMGLSLVGAMFAFKEGSLVGGVGISFVSAMLLGACVEVLSEVNMARAYRDMDDDAEV